jgi:hypothetical protein
VGNLAFLLFDRGVKTLLLSGTMESAGPPCSVGRDVSWCQSLGTVLQVEGTCGAARPVGLNHLVPTRHRRPWSLLAFGCVLLGARTAVAGTGEQSL